MKENLKKERTKNIILWGVTVLIFVGCLAALYFSGFFEAVGSEEAMQDFITDKAPWSHLAYFFIQLMSVIVAPIPSNITAMAGAVLFGTLFSFLLTWGAVVLGSLLMFFLARALGQSFAERFVSRKLSEKYLDIIKRKRDTFLFLAFLFPFFPDDILCILAGLTDIGAKRFILLTLIARPWGLLFACGLGGSAFDIPIFGLVLIGAVGVVIFILAMIYGDRIEEMLLRKFGK